MYEVSARAGQYRVVPGDPLEVREYQLKNGLHIFLSVNRNEPRIATNIAFRVGSKHDPADLSGLAHYMEHMLFKGTGRIGALDWETEKALLTRIADLFEQHRQTVDAEQRREIYREIDRLSYEAAQWVAPNEYDRLATAIGSQGVNAYTSFEQTVYVNDIPNTELERWIQLEAERFRQPAWRLFHTELETVYEEYNVTQDQDHRQANQVLRAALFPTHPYGQQTTIGSPEHLKNPSIHAIDDFYRRYYVPNNAAIIMAGDLDVEQTIAWLEQYFGSWTAGELPPEQFETQQPVRERVFREISGIESAYVELAWPLGKSTDETALMSVLVQNLLHNQQIGLLDRNLVQSQRILEAETLSWLYKEYGAIGLYGKPREGQSLESVEELLLEQVDRLQKGEFPDWVVEAIVRDMKLADLKATDHNSARVSMLTNCFILGIPWDAFTERYTWFEQLTKKDVMAFARQYMPIDRYAVVYKRQGPASHGPKIDKPEITPLPIQREQHSAFAEAFLRQQTPLIRPKFVDFQQAIQRETFANGQRFEYVRNPHHPTFRLDYIFDLGRYSSRELSLALYYLPFLGTDRYAAGEWQTELFRLGLQFEAYSYDDRCYMTLTGLEESLEAGLKIVEHIMQSVRPDLDTWRGAAANIISKRENAKQERQIILREALLAQASYGDHSPFKNRLSAAELAAVDPRMLTDWIHDLGNYQHRIYYFGQRSAAAVKRLIEQHHHLPAQPKAPLPPKTFVQLPTRQNRVLFVDFPIVQTDLLLLSRGTPYFNLEEYTIRDLYNEYFGYGLSSIVFQELRESKALAYSTYAVHTSPSRQEQSHYLQAYIGTQPDKVADALPTLLDLIEYMPYDQEAIATARHSILSRIQTDRIRPGRIFWEYLATCDRGYERDLLRDVYERIESTGQDELRQFHESYIAGRNFDILVVGDKHQMDFDFLGRFGPVREYSLEEIFGY